MMIYFSQYTVSGRGGPAFLLVHGFGACLEHFRENTSHIAENGNRVWAVTLLGFGKSEKPNIVYTEIMWAQLVRDFIIEVVGEPVHLVGNSIGGMLTTPQNNFYGRSRESGSKIFPLMEETLIIQTAIYVIGEINGCCLSSNSLHSLALSLLLGYFVAIVARLWPAVAKSVVLVNSAGNVIPEYSAVHLSGVRNICWTFPSNTCQLVFIRLHKPLPAL